MRVYLPDGGTLVIDGYHLYCNLRPGGLVILAFELPRQTAEQTIPGELALIGTYSSEMVSPVNSHGHFDHSGGNKHCGCEIAA
jgi:4-pyridoxolactonase